jgi:thiol:disulfide interchange protein DsbC
MYSAFLTLFLFLALAISYQLSAISYVYSAVDACGTDCMKCHALGNEEVTDILSKIKTPDAKILKIQMSPVRGLWEVSIDNNGQKGLFYVDFSKKYIITGKIFEINTTADKTGARLKELNKDRKVDLSRIPLKDAIILGNKKANKKIIIFTDPDCPFCGKFHVELKKVVEQRKDIAFYIKLFPLTELHPDALWKSKSILCNKSIKLLEDNFEKKSIPKPNCETDEVDANIRLAKSLGISGTPTSIMPDGSVHVGFLEADKLIKVVDSVKNKAKKEKKS